MPTSSTDDLRPRHEAAQTATALSPLSVWRAYRTVIILFLILVGLIAAARFLDIDALLDPSWAGEHFGAHGDDFTWTAASVRGVALFIVFTATLSPLGVPRQALSALGGYCFGAAYGTLFTLSGLVMGCAAGFFAARLIGRSFLQARFGPRIRSLDAFLAENPFTTAISIRLLPMGNNALTTLTAGVTSIPATPFVAGSGIGYLPQTLIFALLGSGIRVDPAWRIGLAALLFGLAALLGFRLYVTYLSRRRQHPTRTVNTASDQHSQPRP